MHRSNQSFQPSPAMSEIISASSAVSAGGYVAADHLCTVNNAAEFKAAAGEEIFDMMIAEVRKAKKQVLVQTFGWSRHTKFARDFKEVLLQISKERAALQLPPLKVFIIVDELGKFAQLMFRKTTRVRLIQHPKDIGLDNIPDNIDIHLGVFHHNSFGATHAKTVIVDEEVGMITGANFQTTFYGEKAYHDAAILLRGPVLKAFFDDFNATWKLCSNKSVNTAIGPVFDEALTAAVVPDEARQAAVIYASSKVHPTAYLKLLGLQSPVDHPLNASLLAAIRSAEHFIRIATPNLGTRFILDALADFINHKNGKVELLMTRKFNNARERFYGGTNDVNLNKLLKKIDADKQDNISVRWYCKNETAKAADQAGVLHMKLILIDDNITIAGSANLDQLSSFNAHEANVVIDNPEFTRYVRDALFTNIFACGIDALPDKSVKMIDRPSLG